MVSQMCLTCAYVFVECFRTFYPRLAAVYDLTLQRVWIMDGVKNTFFPQSPFAAQSLNTSNRSLAISHTDAKNLVFGICAIIPLGLFNAKTSAHLILIEPKVIIELRPGDVFFFPSAILRFSK